MYDLGGKIKNLLLGVLSALRGGIFLSNFFAGFKRFKTLAFLASILDVDFFSGFLCDPDEDLDRDLE